MLPQLATVITTAVNLVEAEGRLARIYIVRIAAGLALFALAIAAVGIGLLAAIVGVGWLLTLELGVPMGLIVTGALVAALAASIAWGLHQRLTQLPTISELRARPVDDLNLERNTSHDPAADGSTARGSHGSRVPQNQASNRGEKAVVH